MDRRGPEPSRAAPAMAVIVLSLTMLLPAVAALQPTKDAWPQFRGLDGREGVSPSPLPGTNETLWELWLPGEVKSSFAISEGMAVVGCDDGNVYCFDADTGDELWTFPTGNTVQSSPTVDGGRVYIGTSEGRLLCLQLSDGSLVWEFGLRSTVGSPALWNNTVYIADQWGELYALDIVTGQPRWNDTMPWDVWASPTVVDGRLYLGTISGAFRCYNASTGAGLWERQFDDSEIYSSACVHDGRVLVGTGKGASLRCLDAGTGDDVWTFETVTEEQPGVKERHEVYSSAAVSGGIVYIHSWGWLWALPFDDPDGSGTIGISEAYWWFRTSDDEGGSSPVVSGDRLVVGSSTGVLRCLEVATGSPVWNVTQPGYVHSSPALASGRVYVGWTSGYVACVGPPETPRLYTTLIPTDTVVEGGMSITIDITVLDVGGEPAGDAFMAYSASEGTLSATFGTVVEGKFRISWTAPDVSSTATVLISATGELPGWEVVPAELVITVEPAEEAPEPEVPTIAHPGLMVGVAALLVIDSMLAVVIVRGRRRGGARG